VSREIDVGSRPKLLRHRATNLGLFEVALEQTEDAIRRYAETRPRRNLTSFVKNQGCVAASGYAETTHDATKQFEKVRKVRASSRHPRAAEEHYPSFVAGSH